MTMLERDKIESIMESIKIWSDYPWHHKLNYILEHDQAQRAVIEGLKDVCANAYVVVGQLSHDAGLFEHPINTYVLDNLSAGASGKQIPHKNIPAYPASQKIEQQAKRIQELEQWQNIVTGTGTDQEAVIRMAATEYTKVAIQAWKEKCEQQAKENQTLREALRFIATQNKPGNWAVEIAQHAIKEVS